jgi:hypothetical protein
MTDEDPKSGALRDVPVDWEALEDAFENNAPEVHSYLQLTTGEVIRVVDGLADPQMHARIAGDTAYLRVDPVSSREQYRWMERFIPMVENVDLRARLSHAIDGKGAFRRFKDALMAHAEDRERWFVYRSERLRTFMDAWLNAHNLKAVPRPVWAVPEGEAQPESVAGAPPPSREALSPPPEPERRRATTEPLRQRLRDVAEGLSLRDLETLVAFGDFLRARRAARQSREEAEAATAEAREERPDDRGDDAHEDKR